jgi:hypothetical protein
MAIRDMRLLRESPFWYLNITLMLYFLFNYNLKQILDCLILLAEVNGHDYLNFLRTHLSGLLEDAFFSMLLHMWFQHNGAPPQYSSDVLQSLSKNYRGRWIDRGHEVPASRPACWYALSSLDSFQWEYLKPLSVQSVLERNCVIKSNNLQVK